MRIILMGTGPFAVPSFEQLRSDGFDIPVVISRPEVTGSNSKKGPPPSPVRLWAESHGIPTASPDSMNTAESIDWLKQFNADLLFVCDYGQILSRDCLAASRLGGINLHGSLLPRHRGAAPVQWSILSGDHVAGATIIHMTPGLDAGPVLATVQSAIDPQESSLDLEGRLSYLGRQATLESLQILSPWDPATPSPGKLQDPKLATKAPRLQKQDGQFDCRYSAKLIDQQIRGLQPWPGCFANLEMSSGAKLRLLILNSHPISDTEIDKVASTSAKSLSPAKVGTLLYGEPLKNYKTLHPEFKDVEIAIRVQDGWMVLDTIQPAGKRSMSGAEFARGYAKLDWIRVEDIEQPHSLLERMASMGGIS